MNAMEWFRALIWMPTIVICLIAFFTQPVPSRAYWLQFALAFTLNGLSQLDLPLKLFLGLWTGGGLLSLTLAGWESYHRHWQLPSWLTRLMTIAILASFALHVYVYLTQK